MTAYVIAIANVTDEGQYADIRRLAGVPTQMYDGKFLARGGKFIDLEGEISADRAVVAEYRDPGTAKRLYDSSECRVARATRAQAATFTMVGVGGA